MHPLSDITEVRDDGVRVIRFSGNLTIEDVAAFWSGAARELDESGVTSLVLDFRAVEHFDTSAVVFAASIRQHCRAKGRGCEIRPASASFAELLEAAQAAVEQLDSPPASRPNRRRVAVLGEAGFRGVRGLRNALVFVGELAVALGNALRHPGRIRRRDTLAALERNGADALPVVAMICFLMGVIMAFQAAVQLHAFGADIFVADLVGLSIARELGPLMVAVLIAGRSGAGFAAEIGAMKVGEEVDALETLGLSPARFLITPKVLALLLAAPLLTAVGDGLGILGGMLTARTVLGIPFVPYWNETRLALSPTDVAGGLVKSVAFALLIAGIGCYRGLQVEHDPQSVGRQTTSAVVTGIFFIILADAVFSVVYNALHI